MATGAEVAAVGATCHDAAWAVDAVALCRSSGQLYRVAGYWRLSAALATVVGLAAIPTLAWPRTGTAGPTLALALLGLALVAALAAVAMRAGIAIAQWLAVLGQAFDAASEAQVIVAGDGRLLQANTAFKRLFPGAGDAALDLLEAGMAGPAIAAMFYSLRQRAATDDNAVVIVELQPSDAASPRLFEASIERGVRQSGCCLWTFRDVTAGTVPRNGSAEAWDEAEVPDHRSAASSLTGRQPRESVQQFFGDAPVGIGVVDRSGRFVRANRALGELFDCAPQSLIGRGLIGCLHPDDRPSIAAMLAAAAAGRDNRTPVEIRLERPSERSMVVLLSRVDHVAEIGATPTDESDSDAAGSGDEPSADLALDAIDGVTLYFIDVTEQKLLERQFAQSQKMQAVGQLAGGVAHDFNNLLTAMIGFCDLLLLRARPGDPAFGDIMQIKQNANRAANLVRQLLAFSRQQSLQPRVLDVTDVLVELAHLLRRLIGENIDLEFAHGQDLGLVKVDQGQLDQVIINLAVNARDAMPEGGRLRIRTENATQPQAVRRGHELVPAGDYVLIEVADTGIGISPDHIARIFEPFFSTKEVGSGTGLGLSTVYGIVKQTGGFVFVDSVPGGGTSFTIYLPRHGLAMGGDALRPDPAEPTIFPRDLTGTGTIMLVEDDDAVRVFGARALRNKGYRVVEARSGEAALGLIGNGADPIDLLITDVVMPEMDGPALIRQVRDVDPGIKVIFISGYAEDAFRQRLDSERDIDFLAKPFSLQELAGKVKEVMRGDRARMSLSHCV
jgi:PAS domain S-box-containing protein